MQDSTEKQQAAHPPVGVPLPAQPAPVGKSEGLGEAPVILAGLSPASVPSPPPGGRCCAQALAPSHFPSWQWESLFLCAGSSGRQALLSL